MFYLIRLSLIEICVDEIYGDAYWGKNGYIDISIMIYENIRH